MYLISDIDEYFFLKSKKKKIVFYKYKDYINSTIKDTGFFFECLKFDYSKKNNEFAEKFSLNWYKNIRGEDLLNYKNLCIGPIISRRLSFVFINTIRVSLALNYWLKKNKKIYVSTSLKEVFQNIDDEFKRKIFWVKIKPKKKRYQTSLISRTSISTLKIHPLSSIARLLQKPFLKTVQNRDMYFKDWFTKNFFAEKNVITKNNIDFLNGFYLKKKIKLYKFYNKQFPFNIKQYVDKKNLKKIFNIEIKKHINLEKIFFTCLHTVYCKNRNKLVENFSIIHELLQYYKPKKIFLPGENSSTDVTILAFAKILKIKTSIVLDGYHLFPSKNFFFKCNKNKEFLFDEYCAYGKKHKKILEKIGLKSNKIKLINSPIKYFLLKKKGENKIFDAVILTLNSNFSNFQCSDNVLKLECDIIKILEEIKFYNICIKIKPGLINHETTRDLTTYKNLYKKLYNQNISCNIFFNDGNFKDIATKSKIIIGQPSTAYVESLFYKVPYYLFCPPECGQSMDELKSSTFFKYKDVAKNIDELKKNILSKKVIS